jgi:hypothetical protein
MVNWMLSFAYQGDPMSFRRITGLAALALLAMVVHAADAAAQSRCTRLGFSVNDYGKEGPIRDAKALLDKHIAKWAAENGIKNYRTGKKDVTCELYLDLIVFDEYTCKAEASVCWSGGPASAITPADGEAKRAPAKAPAKQPAVPAGGAPVSSPQSKPDAPKAKN